MTKLPICISIGVRTVQRSRPTRACRSLSVTHMSVSWKQMWKVLLSGMSQGGLDTQERRLRYLVTPTTCRHLLTCGRSNRASVWRRIPDKLVRVTNTTQSVASSWLAKKLNAHGWREPFRHRFLQQVHTLLAGDLTAGTATTMTWLLYLYSVY